MDVVRCAMRLQAAEKACGTERCSCHHGKNIMYSALRLCLWRRLLQPVQDKDQDEVEEEAEADVEDDEETEHRDRSDDEWE